MGEYSTEEIIRGIGKKKDKIIDYVYASCYPDIRRLILANSGNDHDVKDIFQDGMLIVYQKISEKALELKCSFKTYLYSVCRFLWLQELEKRSRKAPSFERIEDLTGENENQGSKETIELKLYEKHFNELSKECQTVLHMYFEKATMEEIAVVMGYKNIQIAKDKKYRCKKSLMNKISNNPEFKRLQDEIYLAG
jgi:RNA polymerase sigma factor (sigma-70 family)